MNVIKLVASVCQQSIATIHKTVVFFSAAPLFMISPAHECTRLEQIETFNSNDLIAFGSASSKSSCEHILISHLIRPRDRETFTFDTLCIYCTYSDIVSVKCRNSIAMYVCKMAIQSMLWDIWNGMKSEKEYIK